MQHGHATKNHDSLESRHNFQDREITWTWCWGHLVFYQPIWWPKTTLSYVISKHLMHGLVEQLVSVVPLSFYIIMFDYILIRAYLDNPPLILGGLVAVIFGLWFFIEGLKFGLMPLAEKVGYLLVQKFEGKSLMAVGFSLFFVVGVGVTMAEPSILALQSIGAVVSVKRTPYLYYILNDMPMLLSFCIGSGVGLAFGIGFLKINYEIPLKPLLLGILIPTLLVSTAMSFDKDLIDLVGLAWDCGAITTGEVTVPVIVSLGAGLVRPENPFASLGLVTMGSLLPITVTQFFAIGIWYTVPRESIKAVEHPEHLPWYELPGLEELLEALKITVPLFAFLLILIRVLFRSEFPVIRLKDLFGHQNEYLRRLRARGDSAESSKLGKLNYLWPAIGSCVVGLFLFNVGLNYGLSVLGYDVGLDAPHLFLENDKGVPALYGYVGGLIVLLIFGLILGYLATVAEPAMEILGIKVEELSQGKFSKNMFIHSVSFGVGIGVVFGIIKVIYRIYILYMLLPIYWICMVLTYFSDDAVAHVAWDGGAVTTGPVTVPLVLALGIAVAVQVQSFDGFGILALASICPVASVLVVGLITKLPAVQAWMKAGDHYEEIVEAQRVHDNEQLVKLHGDDDDEVLLGQRDREVEDETAELRPGDVTFRNYGTL